MPSRNFIPEWYKNASPFSSGREFIPSKSLITIKGCTPFIDTLTSGYILTLWQDIYVDFNKETGEQNLSWAIPKKLIESRGPESMQGFPTPLGYNKVSLAITHPLYIKTPKGYSVMVSHPYNRFDLPFMALTGIVDTDIYPLFPGNYPIYIKENFSGIIPKGTPLLQEIIRSLVFWVFLYLVSVTIVVIT